MLPKSKLSQFGHPGNKVKGIVIHNTNNQYMSAEELETWLKTECRTNQGTHYFVDAKEVRQVMPLTWSVYNVGNGNAFGNTDCIAVEICSNPSTAEYLKAQSRAIDLIKELMVKYKLTEKEIYFHRDFQRDFNCPAQILAIYGNKQNFLNLLKGENQW